MKKMDLIVIGGGASGMMSAITAARRGKRVLLLEKLPGLGAKLKASGGGRCNFTNTLKADEFMARFGRGGRFMTPALKSMDTAALMSFFAEIGVKSHAPDGFRVFPETHDSITVLTALEKETRRLGVEILRSHRVEQLNHDEGKVTGASTKERFFPASNAIVATGGLGYPSLGAEGDGYRLAKSAGHEIKEPFPAMLPLLTKETWGRNCRADTIGKAELRINLPEAAKLGAKGDLIFSADGIQGPVVLDFAREITPILAKHGEVPLLVNLTGGLNEEEIREHLKKENARKPQDTLLDHLGTLLPRPCARELCLLAGADPARKIRELTGEQRERIIKILAWTPLTVVGHNGFEAAMITRGGVSLKEIRPETLESRLLRGLYFCGEVVDLDGPCGGFNLQWAFSSGYLAGHLGEQLTKTV